MNCRRPMPIAIDHPMRVIARRKNITAQSVGLARAAGFPIAAVWSLTGPKRKSELAPKIT
jgi:hypothetical protein